MEGLGQLTGGLAHDFNNLLTVIQGNLQALQDLPAVRGDPTCAPLVNAAMRATHRGADLTRSLLTFARRQQLAPAPVDAHAMLRSLLSMLRRTFDQRIQLELEDPPGRLSCIADPVMLESVLLNIAINARDAMPEGGTLCCSVARADEIPASVFVDPELRDDNVDAYVVIAISDTGSGMTPEVRERVFDPFFTTKPPGRGTGLGLSAAYGFAKQSRGAIGIESSPGLGTRVSIYLPLESTLVTRPAEAPGQVFDELNGLEVMLVEDDLEVMAVLLSFLRDLGCVVRAYASGEHVWQALQSELLPQLLISDVALGEGLRGTDLAADVRVRWPAISVLLISGHPPDVVGGSSWPLLLPKPFSREQLADAMSRSLAP